MKYSEAKKYLKVGMMVRIIKYGGTDYQSENRIKMRDEVVKLIGNDNEGWFYFYSQINRGSIFTDDSEELEILTEADGTTPWVNPEPKFKVGDRVRGLPNGYVITNEGWEGEVTRVQDGFIWVKGPGLLQSTMVYSEYFENITPKIDSCATLTMENLNKAIVSMCNSPNPYSFEASYTANPILTKPLKSFKRKESIMESVFAAIKAKLSPTDRMLVKHGYLNSDGTRTSNYESQLKEMAMKKLLEAEDTKEFRDELAAELKEQD